MDGRFSRLLPQRTSEESGDPANRLLALVIVLLLLRPLDLATSGHVAPGAVSTAARDQEGAGLLIRPVHPGWAKDLFPQQGEKRAGPAFGRWTGPVPPPERMRETGNPRHGDSPPSAFPG